MNGELVNNVGNLANRALSMLAGFGGEARAGPRGRGGASWWRTPLARVPEVREAFERLEYRAAIKAITEIASGANEFLQTAAPWKW